MGRDGKGKEGREGKGTGWIGLGVIRLVSHSRRHLSALRSAQMATQPNPPGTTYPFLFQSAIPSAPDPLVTSPFPCICSITFSLSFSLLFLIYHDHDRLLGTQCTLQSYTEVVVCSPNVASRSEIDQIWRTDEWAHLVLAI